MRTPRPHVPVNHHLAAVPKENALPGSTAGVRKERKTGAAVANWYPGPFVPGAILAPVYTLVQALKQGPHSPPNCALWLLKHRTPELGDV